MLLLIYEVNLMSVYLNLKLIDIFNALFILALSYKKSSLNLFYNLKKDNNPFLRAERG
jgi:hypothetical protein